jgi:uncharacterized repeat protein (TIGR04138 family)
MDAAFFELLRRDKRYKAEAYSFVFETLDFAQNVLKLGQDGKNEPLPPDVQVDTAQSEEPEPRCHVTGQDLCCAARDYAQRQYGLLAPMVLGSMGIRTTGDIGEIVYNLISIGRMRKTPDDRREDFDNVFDLRHAFDETYRITPSG